MRAPERARTETLIASSNEVLQVLDCSPAAGTNAAIKIAGLSARPGGGSQRKLHDRPRRVDVDAIAGKAMPVPTPEVRRIRSASLTCMIGENLAAQSIMKGNPRLPSESFSNGR
jgi:hypothetical protein